MFISAIVRVKSVGIARKDTCRQNNTPRPQTLNKAESFIVNLSTDSNRRARGINPIRIAIFRRHIRSHRGPSRFPSRGAVLRRHRSQVYQALTARRTGLPARQSLSRLLDPGQFSRPSIHHLYLNRKPRHSISYLLRRCRPAKAGP